MGKRTVVCRSHCGNCGRHFSNDWAFDRHRKGPATARYCADPAEVKALGVKSYTGICELGPYVKACGPVWTLASSLRGAEERVAPLALNRMGSEAA